MLEDQLPGEHMERWLEELHAEVLIWLDEMLLIKVKPGV